jgi:UDP-glucose 4-epimerase
MNKNSIIITGHSGYIGSCVTAYLHKKFKKKYSIIGIDKNKENKFLGQYYDKSFKVNLLESKKIKIILKKYRPIVIIHLAAKSEVNEKISQKHYIKNNTEATKRLILNLNNLKLNNLIFASTAALYKNISKNLKEDTPKKLDNNYAKTKFICEKLIKKNLKSFIILRFFNVCSALQIGNRLFGELHNPENHLIPTVITKALFDKKVKVFGNNFNTPDRTAIRDYIHIKDICIAVENSIKLLLKKNNRSIFNLGTGKGYSIKDIINETSKYLKKKIFFDYAPRRKGDKNKLVCNIDLAKKKLKWKPKNSSLKKIIFDEMNWIRYYTRHKRKRIFK